MEDINYYLKKEVTELSSQETNAVMKVLSERLLIEFSKQDKSGVYGTSQRLLTYNSNKMEGSTLTEKQTASLFETGTIMADGEIFRAKDIEETRGHFMMFNEMLGTILNPLTEELVKKYHFRLKSGVFEDLANGYPVGEYKNRINTVSDIRTVPPDEVPGKMNELLVLYEKEPVKNLMVLAKFHADFEKIHPFQDGNGRTGRLLLFKECLRHNIIPFIMLDQNKGSYYEALNKAQNKSDYTLLTEIFVQEQTHYYSLIRDFLFVY